MQEESKKSLLNPIIIMSIIVFIVGFGLGFYIWGYHKSETKDYKEMLRETIGYIDSMERLNADMSKEVDGLKKDNSMLKSPSNAQLVGLQSKIQSLQNENTSLRSMVGQSQYLIQENARLNSENQMLRSKTGASPMPNMQQGVPQQGMNAVPQAPGGQKEKQ
jgi:regulator of replication initiation timing